MNGVNGTSGISEMEWNAKKRNAMSAWMDE